MVGLAFSLLGHGLVMAHSPDLKEPCPSWVWGV
eukprot:CAMPEP_0197666920 /NCGR_PEP_ID=MMETSP1338-20131121/64452_1 /TAXON_ID=43686 ORGANISM="Pelagodinium beii, Strain RCC1491" /NCGR_SAMPLE_ID=MMETSP1338 /ASSEMBLY_ACC=CAM_ASM_000754 /LENGTH=32 /DNA_ID= /DNA_START= /DNA_END= /DNA_ORIENTATION=